MRTANALTFGFDPEFQPPPRPSFPVAPRPRVVGSYRTIRQIGLSRRVLPRRRSNFLTFVALAH